MNNLFKHNRNERKEFELTNRGVFLNGLANTEMNKKLKDKVNPIIKNYNIDKSKEEQIKEFK